MKTDPSLTADITELLVDAKIVILTPSVWMEKRDGRRERYVLLISGSEEGPPVVDRFDCPDDLKEARAFRDKVWAHLMVLGTPRVIIDTDDEREAVRVATTLWPNDQNMRRIGQEMDDDPAGIH